MSTEAHFPRRRFSILIFRPLNPSLRYHQFIRLTVKLDRQVTVESSKVIATYIDDAVNNAKMRQELYLKALQLGDQSLTSTLELWEKHPEKITSKQLRDFFKMYKEMEQVRQNDEVIKEGKEGVRKVTPFLISEQLSQSYRY